MHMDECADGAEVETVTKTSCCLRMRVSYVLQAEAGAAESTTIASLTAAIEDVCGS